MANLVAYLVLAYRSPDLLYDLTRSIQPNDRPVLVHVDSRCDLNSYKTSYSSNVEYIDSRFECPWGSFGRVSATIELIRHALEYPVTHLALVSEDSFLLHDPNRIEDLLPDGETTILMDLVPMGSPSKPVSRISKKSPFRGDPRRQGFITKIMDYLFTRVFVNRGWQSATESLSLFAGDSWWVISRKAAEEIIEFVDSKPETVKFLSSTWIADEHFFQIILGNSKTEYSFVGSPMLANWTFGQGSNPPYFLTELDEQWIRSGKRSHLFARKVEAYSKSFSLFTEGLRSSIS